MHALRIFGWTVALSMVVASAAVAGGVLVADGGFGGLLDIKEQVVRVTVNNGIAVTRVEQVFKNTEDREVEALYIFPVPKGASVASFSMWIAGKEMVGEVVEKERARQIYESYKARRIDPGLLEQTDFKTFEMRVYPIGPRAEQKVQITYYQELDFDHDWATYVYPLATAPRPGLVQRTTGKFALSLEVLSEAPIVKMESPSHRQEFVVVDHAPNCHHASLETTGGSLSRDVVVAFKLSRPHTGVDLIASKPEGEDGYFSLTVTAGEELNRAEAGADYVFILDVSGSMRHDGKLRLSRRSVGAFIRALEENDRFEVITFNVRPTTLFSRLEPVNDTSRQRADTFLASTEARGGTRLRPAVGVAYKYGEPDRTLNVVILTDGMTEQRERLQLLQLIRNRPPRARIFGIGVGNEVERPLIRRVVEEAGGFVAFLSREDDFDRQARAFRRKVTRPAATDMRLSFQGVGVYDLEPERLPNLYHGMPIRVYGRYRGGGDAKVVLEATVEGRDFRRDFDVSLPVKAGGNSQIERMWAWQRVQRLRPLAKKSPRSRAVNEIVRLGEAYSIATEWTSFIVLENDGEYQRWKIDRKNALRVERDRARSRKLRKMFASIREKADANLGPNAVRKAPAKPEGPQVANAPRQTRPNRSAPARSPRRDTPSRPSRSSNPFDIGGGAVDPVTGGIVAIAGALAWLARRRRRDHERC